MRLSRPLVTGSDGLLGRAVAERLGAADPETIAASRAFLDLEDFWRLRAEMERLGPGVVVNCAAYSDVDGCERDPDRAYRENRDIAVHLARACRAMGIPLVHISTDYVFDGRQAEPYREEDAPNPLSLYGESKLEGEREALREHPDTLIIRTSFLFGPGRPGFLDRVLEAASSGGTVRAVIDWVNAPTHTRDLAEAIEALVDRGARGVVHFANQPAVSKLEFAREVLRLAQARQDAAVPVRRADLGLPAVRPERTALDCTRYASITGAPPRPWAEAIVRHLAEVRA